LRHSFGKSEPAFSGIKLDADERGRVRKNGIAFDRQVGALEWYQFTSHEYFPSWLNSL